MYPLKSVKLKDITILQEELDTKAFGEAVENRSGGIPSLRPFIEGRGRPTG